MKKILLILAFALLLFTSCGSDTDNGSPVHTHSYTVQENGDLKCICNEEISSPYIAFVNANKSITKYSLLTKSNSEFFVTVSENSITYTNFSPNTQDVVIKTSAGQNLTVNAPNANITHYGDVNEVNIIAVANSSYTGKANISSTLTVSQGHINL